MARVGLSVYYCTSGQLPGNPHGENGKIFMLLNIKDLYGRRLAAIDGHIGHLKDFYFDDQAWAVRYLVADTGSWLADRLVLLSPHAFGDFDEDQKVLRIKLTRKQIEDSPSPDKHLPVSRQYEEDYYRYFGWSYYWQGAERWGMSGFPTAMAPRPAGGDPEHGHNQRADLHLRSTKALIGYSIQATDGALGTLCGFRLDDQRWAVCELVIGTDRWLGKMEISIAPHSVQNISYEDSTIFVSLTRAEIKRTAEPALAKDEKAVIGPDSHGFQQ